jgi:translation initiation factor RLI1
MLEEFERLKQEKIEIEEKAKRDREESDRMHRKHEEEKRQNDRFKLQIKEVERKITEANECVKFMRKNVRFSYQLVSVLPEKFKLDALSSESVQARQEI